jgi:catechol 2,3-dioxygenase-like lactoylglutathione lyase family enzyme
MTTPIGHLQYNIRAENERFYHDLMVHLGWEILYEEGGMLGCGAGNGQSLWFSPATSDAAANHDAPGLNHLAFAAASVREVDELAGWLARAGVAPLYDTPRHRPEFASSDGDTYYQVMFQSPDGILFEMVYIGPA